MFWDFHESKSPCTQKISSLAQKLTILGLKTFMGKMLILGTPFQPLCIDCSLYQKPDTANIQIKEKRNLGYKIFHAKKNSNFSHSYLVQS